MKKALLGIAAIAALIGAPAFAADMPLKAPPPPVPVAPSWAGWYVGAQVGGAWTSENGTETTAFVPPLTGHASLDENGIIGGGHLGYNWQMGNVVFGPEADIEGTSLNRTGNCLIEDAGAGNVAPGTCFPPSYSFNTQIPWQASIRGRLGYAWANTLFYVTGGVEFAEIKTNYTTIATYAPLGSQSFSQNRAGGTVGAGLEYKFNGNWIGRLEYRYADFGTISNSITSGGGFWNGYTEHKRIDENTFRVGISYLFNGPIATKY